MTVLKAIILGIVQGVTEFLPISSSGHLSLAQHFLHISGEGSLFFSVMLHLGTLLAVFLVYYKTIWKLVVAFFSLLRDIFTGKFKWKNMDSTQHMLVMFVISCVPLLLLLLPVGGGRSLMDAVGALAEDQDIMVEGFCFLLTAFLLLFGTWRYRRGRTHAQVEGRDAVAIGLAQMLAASLPGVSRSGSTISTGMMCGVNRDYMVQYSFILGIPAILAANLMELKDAVAAQEPIEWGYVILGVAVAAVVGVAAIKVLEWLVKKDKFKFFGYYCLVLGAAVVIFSALEYAGIV
ncbi:MAG TPA: undecaprenyl-diphosphate phosphatase [Candidatus Fimivicinus intestinavium]|nr:undecaprenyl-diphosphate phosphatase [Candidatus Fimivicinus intestinavium]